MNRRLGDRLNVALLGSVTALPPLSREYPGLFVMLGYRVYNSLEFPR